MRFGDVKRRVRANNSFKTALKCLGLPEKEPALNLPLKSAGGVRAGSTTFRWRALRDSTDEARAAHALALPAASPPSALPCVALFLLFVGGGSRSNPLDVAMGKEWRALRDSNPRPLDTKPAKWGHREHPVTPNLLSLLRFSCRQFSDACPVLGCFGVSTIQKLYSLSPLSNERGQKAPFFCCPRSIISP
jgi:hypothetical protein